MKVAGITDSGDWTFGKGRANYKRDSRAIAQNVATRLRSFVDDWFADVTYGVDWFTLLGTAGTERRILRAVERTVLQTDGVVRIDRLRIVNRDRAARHVTIEVSYVDVFNVESTETIEL